ncbi:ATP-binding protein [Pseudanabaena sp. ABRG5-3]|uniref:ATP-binding protein n=1 Tax=Pseudanabaena sp. ABRG5-3 TaxID=685565 RepID=UPI000DC7102F|nr:ATP-binding protein [Pseudanabaena sp. ABRG5-3]BBC26588.1 heat shock protein 90 [Pseudanabaena sp. ABRG5-3]
MSQNTDQINSEAKSLGIVAQQSEFQIDLQGLIKLLAKNLYAEADVFIREMLQNGHDSVKRRRELQGEGAPPGEIRVRVDRIAGTISFTDNGAGMTETEVREYLSTIGRSGTDAFRQDLVSRGRQAEVTVIGQFGIGLLSAFIVADRVVVETLSWVQGNPAWRWESNGEKTYDLQRGDRKDIGSTVTLYINDKYRDMLSLEELRRGIRKYADFLPLSIYVNDDESPANAVNAPWHKHYDNPKDELLEMSIFVARRFPDNPLSTIPIHLKSPYKVDGVLYVSDNRIPDVNTTGLVDIYQSRMFVVQGYRDMLPSWAKFVRGIIDSPALTLTAARDAVQQDNVQKEIKAQLGDAIIQHLTQLSKDEPTKFQRLCDWHHYHLKGMALRDETFFQSVADLIPFETNQGSMSLQRYFEEAKRLGQSETDLLYFDERGSATQFYMLCEARGLLVVDASQVFEDDFLERYGRLRPEIKLKQLNIGESDFIFEPLKGDEQKEFRSLEQEFMRGMPDRRSIAKAVKFKPESIPALSVMSAAAKNQAKLKQAGDNIALPEEVRKLVKDVLQGERSVPITLYLNVSNPMIQKLAKMPPTEDTRDAYMALYNNSIMLINQILTAQNAEAMFKSFTKVIDRMIAQTDEVQKLNGQIFKLKNEIHELKNLAVAQGSEQTGHVSCFFAMPFDAKYDPLLEATKRILEDKPYSWQVVRADDNLQGLTIVDNVREAIQRSHCYLAEISDANPNVFLEIGMMRNYDDRPIIFLCQEESINLIPADLHGYLYLTYKLSDLNDINSLISKLDTQLSRVLSLIDLKPSIENIYLSSRVLVHQMDLSENFSRKITGRYTTLGDFLASYKKSSAQFIAEEINVKPSSIYHFYELCQEYYGV